MELCHIARRAGRLSSFLLGELGMSSGLVNKLKWIDAIRVNGVPRRTNFPVQPGDRITVRLDEEAPDYPAEDGPLEIVYEDDHLLVVDKPPGMLIHPSRAQFTGTLANLVAGYYRRAGQSSAFHPVTRLDRDTYGIVLLAKNAHIHALLQAAPVEKTYHALVLGRPAEEQGLIRAPIARRPLPSLLREVSPAGKPSVTGYQVLETGAGWSKLALRPFTGRTHQLRVHCAYMGCPILGDPQYGNDRSWALSQALGLDHQRLCAKSLAFPHPIGGEALVLHSRMDATL